MTKIFKYAKQFAIISFCFLASIVSLVQASPDGNEKHSPAVDDGISEFKSRRYEHSFALLMPEAQRGDPAAQTFVGMMYRDGLGRPLNLKQAMRWLGLAAAQEYQFAFREIGKIYDDGILVPRDVSEAAKWYKNGALDSRYFDLTTHRDSDVYSTSPYLNSYDPQNFIARAERQERIKKIYDKLNANIALPPDLQKGQSFVFNIETDSNRMVTSVSNLYAGKCIGCRADHNQYNDPIVPLAFAAIVEGVKKASPIPELPSWYANARSIRIVFPQEEDPAITPKPGELQAYPDFLEGIFLDSFTFDSSSKSLQFKCNYEGCNYSESVSIDAGEPVSNTQRIDASYVFPKTSMKSNGLAKSAWQYALDHRSNHAANNEQAAITAQLRPFLDENSGIGDCLPVNSTDKNTGFICLTNGPQLKSRLLFYFKATPACGDVFCNYLIYPLHKVGLAVRATNPHGTQ